MRPTVLVPVLVLVLLVVWLLAGDPLGLFEHPVGRPEAGGADTLPLDRPGDASLQGRALPARGSQDGVRDAQGVAHRWIDLHLGTGRLEGVVTGEGPPLAGARVDAAVPGTQGAWAVTTDAKGAWAIRGLPAGSFDVRARALGFVGRNVTSPPLAEGATLALDPIDLAKKRPFTDGIEVEVRDETGRPIPGAHVLATTMLWSLDLAIGPGLSGTPGALEKRAIADEHGIARLAPLAPEKYDVVAIAEGYETTAQPSVSVAGGQVKHLVFRMKPGQAIQGSVVGVDGKPVEDAYVIGISLANYAASPTVRSASDGSFTLGGLRTGAYWVIAGRDDAGEGSVRPANAPGTGVRIRLGGAGTVDLTVVDDQGRPVPSYRVRPYREGPYGYTYSLSREVDDPQGATRLSLSPGTWKLSVQDAAGNLSESTQVTVEAGANTSVQVKLPASASITGVVVDPSGNLLEGAEVFVKRGGMPPEPKREQYARTDAGGSFAIHGLAAGIVNLHVVHPLYAPRVFEVSLQAGASTEETFALEAGATIQGTVERGGQPIAGLQMNVVEGQNWFEPSTTVTDQNGRYRVTGLGEGTYMVTTGAFEMQSAGAVRQGVVVGAGATVTVDFALEANATGVVQGTVTSAGQPLPGVSVSVRDEREVENVATSDADGAYRVIGVSPGNAFVWATSADGVTLSRRVSVPKDGTPVTTDLAFGAAGVVGRLLTADGDRPISGAWISVEEMPEQEGAAGRQRGTSSSDPQGVFRVLGLPPGRYRVRATGSGHAALLTDPFSVGESGLTDLGTFRLGTGTALEGTVRDDAGKPVEKATIALEDAAGRPVFLFSLVTTGSDGRYAASGLEPGHYVVRFEAKGYAPDAHPVDLGTDGATVDGVLRRGGRVEVTVVDDQGRPIAGAHVVLVDERGQVVRRTLSLANLEGTPSSTGSDGRVVLPDLAPGTYAVRAEREGYEVAGGPVSVVVGSAETARATVTLAAD